MARKEFMDEENGVFTLNETTVGKGGNNRKRSDVQLVQFFLQQFYFAHPELFVLLPKTRTGSFAIKIDGICGKQTEMGIRLFQEFQRSQTPTAVDGLVNVAHSLTSSITGTFYTIHLLNHWFTKFGGGGKELNGNLENHPDIRIFAPELHTELVASQVGDEFQ